MSVLKGLQKNSKRDPKHKKCLMRGRFLTQRRKEAVREKPFPKKDERHKINCASWLSWLTARHAEFSAAAREKSANFPVFEAPSLVTAYGTCLAQ